LDHVVGCPRGESFVEILRDLLWLFVLARSVGDTVVESFCGVIPRVGDCLDFLLAVALDTDRLVGVEAGLVSTQIDAEIE
jgi:hypothetical protein